MNIIIGAQYYTIRDYCKTLEDFKKACKKVSEIGYRAVQLSGIGDFSAEDIKAVLDRYGLYAVCTHRGADKYLNDLEGEVKFHKTLGCKIAGIGVMPGGQITMESIEKFASDFKPVIKRLKEEGITFAYHNHAYEFEKIDGKFIYDILCEKMEDVKLKFILDVYWLAYAGIAPGKFIREHKEDVACVHFKDMALKRHDHHYAPVGAGTLDWEDIFSACKEAEVPFALVEQDDCYDEDPFICLKESFDFIKKKEHSR